MNIINHDRQPRLAETGKRQLTPPLLSLALSCEAHGGCATHKSQANIITVGGRSLDPCCTISTTTTTAKAEQW